MKEIALTIFFAFLVIDKLEAFLAMGPVGNLILQSLYECPENEKPTGDDITWSGNISTFNGKKVISGSVTTKIPIDATTNYHVTLKKWEKGSWKKYMETKGALCEGVHKILPKFWSKMLEKINPNPGRECPAKPGTYLLENFYATPKDLDVKAIFYGKLTIQTIFLDKNKITACMMLEGVSQAAF